MKATFPGFSPAAQKFFRDLARHNNREWYLQNKSRYEESFLEPATLLALDLEKQPTFRKLGLRGAGKKSVFRLHRDTRFSNSKLPFKDHNGLCLSRSGSKNDWGIFYFHFEPRACFCALGTWHPAPPLLARMRLWVSENPQLALKLLRHLKKAGLEFSTTDQLKRMPRGFEHLAASPLNSLLRLRNWVVIQKLTDAEMNSPGLLKKMDGFVKLAAPVLQTVWPLVDRWRMEDPFADER
ncbi:MAG: DUF2461 domain-containing protein [Bdellovibrionales bacterium]|nr:DUF2461 domain-containing protein [Bdellovibrionales bacterium]